MRGEDLLGTPPRGSWLERVARAGSASAPTRPALGSVSHCAGLLTSWAELTPALVVNRPTAMAANGSKPYQASWIESLGFRIPDTMITTDPGAALEFWRHHDKVIYKSLSGIRSIVSRLTAEHEARFEDIASCPTQFQQYVPGTEYRVHVVGQEVFACRIVSEADDYRYSGEQVDMQPCDLPDDITALCRTLAASMNLLVAGVDLRCTPEGIWFCFEVNPSPGFTYFQEMTGQPIADAIAHLLASASVRMFPSGVRLCRTLWVRPRATPLKKSGTLGEPYRAVHAETDLCRRV